MSYPDQRHVSLWLTCNGYSGYLASNKTTLLSVDFPIRGSCRMKCPYCYAARGHQAMADAVRRQEERYARYLSDPEGYATKLRDILARFADCFELAIGSRSHPLRLFGAGDVGDVKTFTRFYAALESLGVSTYGYSRYLGLPGDLWFSSDRATSVALLEKAKGEGRRIAFVRRPEDAVPAVAKLIFPEHSRASQVPLDPRDCPKIRIGNTPGVCYRCRRCFPRATVASAAA